MDHLARRLQARVDLPIFLRLQPPLNALQILIADIDRRAARLEALERLVDRRALQLLLFNSLNFQRANCVLRDGWHCWLQGRHLSKIRHADLL